MAIIGLSAKINGVTLERYLREAVKKHTDKAKVYSEQVKALKSTTISSGIILDNISGNPVAAAEAKEKEHNDLAQELEFLADHTYGNEDYILSQFDLKKLGKIK